MTGPPILLVEDNPDDVTLTLLAFEQSGISNDVVLAEDGERALSLLFPADTSEPLRPAVILLDLNLPIVSGLDVLKRIRATPSTGHLPVVVLTTSTEEQDLVDSYHFGANSYVLKPVSFGEFAEAAKLLGLYWLLLNEVPRA